MKTNWQNISSKSLKGAMGEVCLSVSYTDSSTFSPIADSLTPAFNEHLIGQKDPKGRDTMKE